MRIQLHLADGSLVHDCTCCVERRDIAGPDNERRFWLLRAEMNRFVGDLPPTEFLLIGPGGKGRRLESMEDAVVRGMVIQAMLDLTGRAPNIDSFSWASVRYFAKGVATRLDD